MELQICLFPETVFKLCVLTLQVGRSISLIPETVVKLFAGSRQAPASLRAVSVQNAPTGGESTQNCLFCHLFWVPNSNRIRDLVASRWTLPGCTTAIESAIWRPPLGCRISLISPPIFTEFGAFWMHNTNRICDSAASLWAPSGCTTRIESAIWWPLFGRFLDAQQH